MNMQIDDPGGDEKIERNYYLQNLTKHRPPGGVGVPLNVVITKGAFAYSDQTFDQSLRKDHITVRIAHASVGLAELT